MKKWDRRKRSRRDFEEVVAAMVHEFFTEKGYGCTVEGLNCYIELEHGMASASYFGATDELTVRYASEFSSPKVVFNTSIDDPTCLDRMLEKLETLK
jgi:hypothetical protein